MSTIGDWLVQNLGRERKPGEPSMIAPASVQAAYQSSQRTGAPPPEAVPLPNTGDAAYLQPETQPVDKPQFQQTASQEEKRTQQPVTQQVVFPEDKWRSEVENVNKKREQALAMIRELAIGTKEGDPEIKAYYEILNQKFPKPKEDFNEVKPMVKQLATKALEDDMKRSTIANMLSSQLALLDSKKPEGMSQGKWEAQLVRELSGPFLSVTNGIMGTTNAVSEAEGSRLIGGASSKYFALKNLNEKGLKINESNINFYKKTLVDAMHSMQSSSNQTFNKLAMQSSPEFASDALGGNILEPYIGKLPEEVGAAIPVTHRISRKNPVTPSRTAPEARAVRSRVIGPGGKFVDLP